MECARWRTDEKAEESGGDDDGLHDARVLVECESVERWSTVWDGRGCVVCTGNVAARVERSWFILSTAYCSADGGNSYH